MAQEQTEKQNTQEQTEKQNTQEQTEKQNTQEQTEKQNTQGQTVIVNQQVERQTNGLGIAGFVVALVALVLFWAPCINWFLWFVGLVLSFVGVFKEPRGLAIAGLVISSLGLIVLLAVMIFLGSLFQGFNTYGF